MHPRCSSQLNLTGPSAATTSRNGPEACDDGNTTTETACPYGTAQLHHVQRRLHGPV